MWWADKYEDEDEVYDEKTEEGEYYYQDNYYSELAGREDYDYYDYYEHYEKCPVGDREEFNG